ncbi:hypothetical protein PG987_004060 [Apiospora arundinis]
MASQSVSMPSLATKPDAKPVDAESKPKVCANSVSSPQDGQSPSQYPLLCLQRREVEARRVHALLSTSADPAADCQSTIQQYRSCMAGFGFKV